MLASSKNYTHLSVLFESEKSPTLNRRLVAWDEVTNNNAPSDRRGMASSGPFYIGAGKNMCLDMAYVYGRGNAGPISSVTAMQHASDSARTFYLQNNPCSCVESTVGIQEQNLQTVSVFPNPANESVNIVCGSSATGSIVEIVDIHGKLIKQSTVVSGNSLTVSTIDLAPGVYLVRVINGSVVTTGKFIRQ